MWNDVENINYNKKVQLYSIKIMLLQVICCINY